MVSFLASSGGASSIIMGRESHQTVPSDQKGPNANGGGHERAGSIKFVEYGREDVISEFKKYLKEVNSFIT